MQVAETQGHKRVKKLLQKVHDDGETLATAAQTGNLHQVHAQDMSVLHTPEPMLTRRVITLSRLALSPRALHAHQIRQLVQPAAGLTTSSHPGGCAVQAINWRNSDARTPLHHAAEHGHAGMRRPRGRECELLGSAWVRDAKCCWRACDVASIHE